MGQMGFLVDATQCSGCKTCQIACKDAKDLPVGALFRRILELEGGVFPDVWAASLSLACNHCADPLCLPNCPVAAISKDPESGLVWQNSDICIGCERCVESCPYHAPAYIPDAMIVGKCDGCRDLVSEGKQPVCVAACSTRALQFGDIEALRTAHGSEELVNSVAGLPSPDTVPSLLIKARREMLP